MKLMKMVLMNIMKVNHDDDGGGYRDVANNKTSTHVKSIPVLVLVFQEDLHPK